MKYGNVKGNANAGDHSSQKLNSEKLDEGPEFMRLGGRGQ